MQYNSSRRRSVTGRDARATRPVVDPIMVSRSRDLLERAYVLLDNADGVADGAERFRQYYLAALRGAGAELAVYEPPGRPRRRGSANAWSRIAVVAPALAGEADVFASLSPTRMRIESGIVRTIDTKYVTAMRAAVTGFLRRVEDLIIAYEQGRLEQQTDAMGHTA